MLPFRTANMKGVVARGEGQGLGLIDWTTAVRYNGLGRYEDALAPAEQAGEHRVELPFAWGLAEAVEAASRSGLSVRAAAALERLSETTRASGSDWALGIEARSRALLSDGETAERHYREAIDRLGRTRVRVALARAHLLYGEWLRRERRRIDARATHLRTATTSSPRWAWKRSPSALRASSSHRRNCSQTHRRDVRRAHRAGGSDRPPRRRRLRIGRSAPSCSSARAPSNGTCATCSRSSASVPAENSARVLPHAEGTALTV
jgi:hypothetical protein